MNTKTLLACAGLALALTSNLHAHWFVRGAVTRVAPTDDSYDAATGFAVTGGKYLGKNSEHELSVEISHARWKYVDATSTDTFTTHEKYTPIVANYRYHVQGYNEFKHVRFYIGPSVGFAWTKLDFSYVSASVHQSGDDSKARLAWGGTAGFIVDLPHNVEIDLGYRYQVLESSDYTLSNINVKADDFKTNTFTLGVGFRF